MWELELMKELKQHNINLTYAIILKVINENPGVILCKLSQECNISKGLTSIYKKKLKEEKLIYLNNDKKIHPTKIGKDLYKNIFYLNIILQKDLIKIKNG